MKKILFILSLAGVALSSCKKESQKNITPVSKNAQSVTFNVGFSKNIPSLGNPLNSTNPDTSLTNHIKVLYYMVFDSIGNNVHNITQLSTDAAFGHYADNLGPGKYTVAITGGGTTLAIQPSNLTSQYVFYGIVTNPADPLGSYVPGPFDQDTYSTFFAITVAGTPLNPPITLNRVISKMTVNINDALPANTTSISLKLNSLGNAYYVGTGLVGLIGTVYVGSITGTATYQFPVPVAAFGTTNFQVSTFFLFNAATPVTVNLAAVNTISQYSTEKNISNVTGAPNKVTLLSGNLFGGNGLNTGNGFKVSVDTTWNTPVVKTF